MAVVRAIIRIVMVVVWFLFMGIFGVILYWGGWKAIRRLAIAARYWSKGCGWIIGLKKHIYGTKSDINGIVVSNHLSYMDIVTISNIFNIRFSPNTDIAKWPVLGWYLGLSRPIWVDRNSKHGAKKTMNEFLETVKNDIDLIVFPEGKISDCKNGLQNFKSTVFEVAVKGGSPIIPVLLHYHDEEICWTKWSLTKHVWSVLKKKRIDVDIRFLEPVYSEGLDRKALAEKIRNIMNKKYKSIYCNG